VLEDVALRAVVGILMEKWAPACLLITLGGDGMALFRADAAPLHIPTRAREVYDVSGAGDTVVATFTLALAAGATPDEAAHLANHAAGVVVAKLGTASVSPQELAASFSTDAGA
jgi:D-beta-D-heptose 7-phosphate kinase/D-beta-D-heptose 1-phosphate adenosyltransferase